MKSLEQSIKSAMAFRILLLVTEFSSLLVSDNEYGQVTTLGFDYDGGFAEYLVAKSSLVLKIPDSLSFEEASIIPDAVSTPWAAISSTGQVKKGESVAVFGIGGLGYHAVKLLKMIGCSKIIAIDPRADARSRALEAGANFAFDPSDESIKSHCGVNCAFDFAGVTPVRKQALSLLGEEGRLIIVGIANEPITIPNDMAFTYMRTQVRGHYGSEHHHTSEHREFCDGRPTRSFGLYLSSPPIGSGRGGAQAIWSLKWETR